MNSSNAGISIDPIYTSVTTVPGTPHNVDAMECMFASESEQSISNKGSNLAHMQYPSSSICRKVKGGYYMQRLKPWRANSESDPLVQKKGDYYWEVRMYRPDDVIGVPFPDRWKKYLVKTTYSRQSERRNNDNFKKVQLNLIF